MLPDVGVPEMLVIAAIALIVVGPKDLPILMRKLGRFLAHMRGMAAEFRASFDELARQSELEELRKEVEAMRAAAQQPGQAAMNSVGLGEVKSEIESHFVMDPHETPQMHVGALGEPIDLPQAQPSVGATAADETQAPRPRTVKPRTPRPKAPKPKPSASETGS